MTIKAEMKTALENLRSDDLKHFIFYLLDRREEPRISRRDVENKSVLDIVDLMVSVFTEKKALQVMLEILRKMKRNEEAAQLESRTKIYLDEVRPTFPKPSTGTVKTEVSRRALKLRHKLAAQCSSTMAKNPKEVEKEAKALVVSECRDPSDKCTLKGFKIHFGQYRGQTFQWLLENDVDYVIYLVTIHLTEKIKKDQDNMMANKDSLKRYVSYYPEIMQEVERRCLIEREGPDGQKYAGFGQYEMMTREELYESEDKDVISFVNDLRKKKEVTPGPKMKDVVQYIMRRDRSREGRGTRRGQPTSAPRNLPRT